MPKNTAQATQVVQGQVVVTTGGVKVDSRLATLLVGFRDLIGERMGYNMGRRLTQEDMSKKTEAERKAVAEIRETITGDNLKKIIAEADVETYEASLVKMKTAREALSKAAKPFRAKIAPLAKAQRYLDNVAIPDALKEMGTPIQPRFNLSEWIDKAIEASKKSKKKKE